MDWIIIPAFGIVLRFHDRLGDNPVCDNAYLDDAQVERFCTPQAYDCDLQENVYGNAVLECKSTSSGKEEEGMGTDEGNGGFNDPSNPENPAQHHGRMLQQVLGDSDSTKLCDDGSSDDAEDDSTTSGKTGNGMGGQKCNPLVECGGEECYQPKCDNTCGGVADECTLTPTDGNGGGSQQNGGGQQQAGGGQNPHPQGGGPQGSNPQQGGGGTPQSGGGSSCPGGATLCGGETCAFPNCLCVADVCSDPTP